VVGETYRVNLEMRRIGAPGQAVFPEAPDFEFVTDHTQIVSSAVLVPFTGNYRGISVWARPVVRQVAPIDLWWHPRERQVAPGQIRPVNMGLRIPVIAKRAFPWILAFTALVLFLVGSLALRQEATRGANDKNGAAAYIALATLTLSAGTALMLRSLDRWTTQG
jgi:hypothetical protein